MPFIGVAWIFLKGLPLWVWPMLALAAALGWQTVALSNSHAATATAKLAFEHYKVAIATQAALDNAKAIEDLKKIQAANAAAVTDRLKAAQKEKDDLEKELEDIRNAPRETDGAVSGNACAYYSRVYGKPACAADRGH